MTSHGPDLDAVLDGCRLAHRRLRETLGRVDDEVARQPSRLAGWTVGHVLTHLARNADSMTRVLEGALAGDHLEQYEGGADQRDGDIEAGAGRTAEDLIDDAVSSFARLEDTWDRMTPEAWQGHGWQRGEIWPCRHLPFFRWREVEVHHVDLGLGYEATDWPDDYVAGELPLALAGLPSRLGDGAIRARTLAWLLGRAPQPDLSQLGPWHFRVNTARVPGDPPS